MTTITIDRAVVEQALEALLDDPNKLVQISEHHWESKRDLAVIALRAALAQQDEPVEPVAWMYTGIKQDGTEHGPHLVWKPEYMDAMSASKGAKATPLYTSPPQRKPLTDQEIDRIRADCVLTPHEYRDRAYGWALHFARAVERAHGIGEEK